MASAGRITRACSSRGPQRFGRRRISFFAVVGGGLGRASLLKRIRYTVPQDTMPARGLTRPTLFLSLAIGCILAVGRPPSLVAQAGTVTVRGQVTDSLGVSIPLAEVLAIGTSMRAVADSNGLFSLAGLRPGTHLFLARGIGWKPMNFTVQLAAGEQWVGRVLLEAAPIRLPDLIATGKYAKPERYASTTKYDDFFRRRALAAGVFRTREQIEAMFPLSAADLLKNIPSVRVAFNASFSSVTFGRCSGPSAKVAVWIDGARVRTSNHNEALSLINPKDIEAMEIYRSGVQIPGEFLEDSCAAIVIWTRWN